MASPNIRQIRDSQFIASAARVLESLPEFEVSDKCIEIATRTDSAQNERLRLAAVEVCLLLRGKAIGPGSSSRTNLVKDKHRYCGSLDQNSTTYPRVPSTTRKFT